jgi:sodium/hydrogen exchanger-like protein 6/7
MFVGLIVRLAPGHLIREMLTFKHTLFFNLLLPPIILNSGYELKQERFFRNFGTILTFAFLGTFTSAIGIGVLVYFFTLLTPKALAPSLSLLECLIFGSTLSATDPVTILAIFQQHKVDPKLYSVIFGESILNDAVSIVMYETLSQFHGSEIYVSSIFHGFGIFLFSFSASMALGVSFGLACSLTLKHSSLSLYPGIESCIVALVAYTSYFFSNGLHMSGIVSLLFCGITLKHYAYHTMSRRTQRTTKYMFSVLAQLSENFIFIYLGLNLFTQDESVFKPLFILVSTIAVIAARYAAVFPLSEIINFVFRARGQRHDELPHSYQMMLFWAGLRGAVGVALAAGFKGINADALKTTVLCVVVLTLIVFGGTTSKMLEVTGIRVGVEDEDASSDEEDNTLDRPWLDAHSNSHHRQWQSQAGPYGWNTASDSRDPSRPGLNAVFSAGSDDSISDSNEVLPMADSNQPRPQKTGPPLTHPGQWSFTALDERYLLPLFSNSVASRSFNARKASRRAMAGESRSGSASREQSEPSSEDEDVGQSRRPQHFAASVTDFFRHMRGSSREERGSGSGTALLARTRSLPDSPVENPGLRRNNPGGSPEGQGS